ncbi:MAG TPA: NADH-quinone oxidoreductase subunit C [Vicinamibacterales bacterium]
MPVAEIVESLSRALPGLTVESWDAADHPVIVVPRESLHDVALALRDTPELNFHFLVECTGVDFWPREPRFEVVYHLACTGAKDFPRPGMSATPRRLRMKVRVPGTDPVVATLCDVWPNANWYEREVYDLFGILFDGHPDLRRVLMPEDWEGHPARKDYPVQVKLPVTFTQPTQVTEEEFVRNIEQHRVRTGARPGR